MLWLKLIHCSKRGTQVYEFPDKIVIDQHSSSMTDLSVYGMLFLDPLGTGSAKDIQPWPSQGNGVIPSTIFSRVCWL